MHSIKELKIIRNYIINTLVSLFLNVVHYKLSFYTQNEEDVLNIIADVLHKAYLYVSLKYLNQINMLKILILKILY